MARVAVRFDGVSSGAKKAAAETRGAIKGVREEATLTQRATASLGSTLRSSLMLGAKVAATGVGALAGAVAFAGFRFDDLKQRSTIAFRTMLGDGGKAKKFLDDLAKFAARTPFEFPDLIRSSQRLMAMGLEAKKVIPTMRSVGDAVAAMGGDPQALEATVRAIGQVQAKGRLMAEEMLQLNEAGTFSWRALAAEIGKSVPDAMKLVTKGAVSSDAFLQAFMRNSQRNFQGMMEQQSHTFSGLLSTVKDTFAQVSGRVMQPFFEMATRGLQRIVDITSTDEFSAGVDRFADALQKKVGTAVREVVAFFREHWGDIKDGLGMARDISRQAAKAILTMATNAERVAKAVGGWDVAAKLGIGAAIVWKLAKAYRALAESEALAAIAPAAPWVVLGALGGVAAGQATKALEGSGGVAGRAGRANLGGGVTYDPATGKFYGGAQGAQVPISAAMAEKLSPGAAAKAKALTRGAVPGELESLGAGSIGTAGPSRVPGHTGPISTGLSLIETATGARVYNDFATSGHAKHSHHYSGEAADLAPDPKVWAALFKRRHLFAELFGPWGLYHYGVQFYDAGLQADHMDHIHVAYTGGPAAIRKAFGGGGGSILGPGAVPTGDTGGGGVDLTGLVETGAGTGTGAGKARKASVTTGAKLLPLGIRTAIAKAARTTTTADDLAPYEAAAESLQAQLRKKGLKPAQRLAIEEELTAIQKKINSIRTDAYEQKMKRISDATRKRLEETKRVIDAARSGFEKAFERLAADAMKAFDKETSRQIDQLDLERKLLTPEEQALAAFDAAREAEQRAADRAAAAAIEDPVERAAKLRELDVQDQRAALVAAAEASREARDKEYEQRRDALQEQRDQQRDQLQQQLADLETYLSERYVSLDTANQKILDLMRQFGLDPAWLQAGIDAADAFYAGLLGARTDAAGPGVSLRRIGQDDPALRNYLGQGRKLEIPFADGGKVPGRYVGMRDMIPARLTPGETVIDRRLTEALEDVFVRGRGGSGPIEVVLKVNDREIARAIAPAMQSELDRSLGYRSSRG